VSYQGGGKLKLGGTPGVLRKGDARVIYRGGFSAGVCPACKKPRGAPLVLHAHLPKGVRNQLMDAAFTAGIKPIAGPCMVGVIATWPSKWGKAGRAEGRPQGDVDAPLSNLLDALGSVDGDPGILYRDDAQIAILVAVNAIGTKATANIEVAARPLSPRARELLALLAAETGLPFDTARLTLGQQETLLR
jgi:hypothetical protein